MAISRNQFRPTNSQRETTDLGWAQIEPEHANDHPANHANDQPQPHNNHPQPHQPHQPLRRHDTLLCFEYSPPSSRSRKVGYHFVRPQRCKESGWRRTSVVSMLVIITLCLLSVIISQQLVTTIPSAPFLAIGRSIQSWSSNEITDAVNISQEIEDVLRLQRSSIQREMLRYKYPAGRFKIDAEYDLLLNAY
ncbi:hypothetical protein AAG570_011340 [Ranatra chinensis]|uniref:Uncharacterized protein n=1 Tax=Ranatra chinensis TaxID=642074 RepID=A0ABD0YWK2_9HEMI